MNYLSSLKKIFIVFLFTCVFILTSNAQTLEEEFKKFELVTINAADTHSKTMLGETVTIGKFNIDLKVHDLRSASFYAQQVGEGRIRKPLVLPSTPRTFKGTVNGSPDSYVRLSISDSVEGYINAGDERIFVEQAQKYSKELPNDTYC